MTAGGTSAKVAGQEGDSLRRTVRIALFASTAAALGFLLAPVPNIELFTFSLFVGGYALGLRAGAQAGFLAVLLYYGLNPYGSSLLLPPLLATQLVAGILIPALGALYGRLLPAERPLWLRRLGLLPFAAAAALALPLLPGLAFALFLGGSWQGWMALGLLMTAWGFLFNLVVFYAGFPPLARQLERLSPLRARGA
jgi:hypothetical protein